ncbi:MAG: hypothetical protein NWQ19_02780 [Nonlabens sp.]|jgi:hypothetical protein|nr:hypothetical protein [Nonlabens sp.]
MNKIKTLALSLTMILMLTSCGTDYPRQEVKTTSLSGFIEGGNAGGIYGGAGLKITGDSIQMNDWQVSKLVASLNTVRDTSLVNLTSTLDFYTIHIANIDTLNQRDFVDSLIVELTRKQLIK